MKKYVSPEIQVFDLRTEENIAAMGDICKTAACPDDIWVSPSGSSV